MYDWQSAQHASAHHGACSPQVRPKRGLTRADVHAALSSKYEGSWLDPALDVTAGPEHTPYRYNGLSWQLKNQSFVNERIVGTQFTAWHFVASVRGRATPAPLRALLWWGADDHAWAPKVRQIGPDWTSLDWIRTGLDWT